jgi:hypothetical protein
VLVRTFPLVERRKEVLEFGEGIKRGIMDDTVYELLDVLSHAFDQGLKQRRFGIKVVVERPDCLHVDLP